METNSVTLDFIKKMYQGKADTNCGIMLLNYLSSLITRVHQIRPQGSICLHVCKYVYVNICTFSCFLIAWRMKSASSLPCCECVSHSEKKKKKKSITKLQIGRVFYYHGNFFLH